MSGILDEIWQQHIASSVAHWSEMAKAAIDSAAAQYERPCVLFKPRLSVDGNQWCALYGDSLQDGVAGFGDSPADAMWDFDRNWGAKLPYTMSSDAGHELAKGRPFAACYWDTPEGRVFSLRSSDEGVDVSEVAKQYGGGGHRNAAGFRVSFAHAQAFEA